MKRSSNILFGLLASNPDGTAVFASPTNPFDCRSNATHIVWKTAPSSPHLFGHYEEEDDQRRLASSIDAHPTEEYQCTIETREDAENACLSFLKNNLMPFDKPFMETLGFSDDNNSEDADGLGNGLVGPTVSLALDAKVHYKWTDDLPRDIFFNYVLNYANLNEARSDWRPLFVDALKFHESDLYKNSLTSSTTTSNKTRRIESNLDIASVTKWVNQHVWSRLARREDQPIYFKSSLTPLIFDPMSTISFGYASCTGTSILFCNALRAVGVPARVAGVPAWYGDRTEGNHNWVEVFVPRRDGGDGEWKFLEPSPALPDVDTLDKDPCDRWFCDPARFPASEVFAATLSRSGASGEYFPLAWERNCTDVPGVNRTDYYARVCSRCGNISGD